MSERFKEAVLKTAVCCKVDRGFESLSLRQPRLVGATNNRQLTTDNQDQKLKRNARVGCSC